MKMIKGLEIIPCHERSNSMALYFNMKEKIKGFIFFITVCNYVCEEHRFHGSGPFNNADKRVTVAGS